MKPLNEKEKTSGVAIVSDLPVGDDKDVSSDELVIDLGEENQKNYMITRKRKRTETNNSSTEENSDLFESFLEVDEKVSAVAAKNNLSTENVKNILKKVVLNEHVLAIVKLREEEVENQNKTLEPKLTRAKTKKLKTSCVSWPLRLTPVKFPKAVSPEVTSLITQDLPDEESDDEYKPTLEEEHEKQQDEQEDEEEVEEENSEEEVEVDSEPPIPVSPASAVTKITNEIPAVSTDGIFKVPEIPVKFTNDCKKNEKENIDKIMEIPTSNEEKSQIINEEEATIPFRTRSKLSLSNTPIEELEESFNPPDEYLCDFDDCHVDNVWRDFLQEFTNPSPDPNVNEDDDEADPEYNIAADKEPFDQEELREDSEVQVSKQELKDLVFELFADMDDIDLLDLPDMSSNTNIIPSFISQDEYRQGASGSPVKLLNISKSKPMYENQSENNMQNYWYQNTNAIFKDENNINNCLQNQSNAYDVKNKFENVNNVQSTKTEKCDNNNKGNSPKIDSSQVRLMQKCSVRLQKLNDISLSKQFSNENNNVEIKPSIEKPINESISTSQEPIKRNNDRTIILRPLYEDWIYKEGDAQLLPEQRLLLDQQMRQHVQLTTQCFLQVYGHPLLWKYAPRQKEVLVTLKHLGENKPNSAFIPCNLLPAIDLCEYWIEMLSKDTPEMRSMIEFVNEENRKMIKRRQQKSTYQAKFTQQFVDTVLNSKVFLYHNMLPSMPFRTDLSVGSEYLDSENQMISMGLEQFYTYLNVNDKTKKTDDNKMVVRVLYKRVAELIVKYMMPFRSISKLCFHLKNMKNRERSMNPIKYFYRTGKAPETINSILPFDPNLCPKDHPIDTLPYVWQARCIGKRTRKVLHRSVEDTKAWRRSRRYFIHNRGIKNYRIPTNDSINDSDSNQDGDSHQVDNIKNIVGCPNLRDSSTNFVSVRTSPVVSSRIVPNDKGQESPTTLYNCTRSKNSTTNESIEDKLVRLNNIIERLNNIECTCLKQCFRDIENTVLPKNQTLITNYFRKNTNTIITQQNSKDTDAYIDLSSDKDINEHHQSSTKDLRLKSILLELLKICKINVSQFKHLSSIDDNLNTNSLKTSEVKKHLKDTIARVESMTMLPSMPFLSTDTQEVPEGSDDSNELNGSPGGKRNNDDANMRSNQTKTPNNRKVSEERPSTSKGTLINNSTKHRVAQKAKRELEANRAMFLTNDPHADDVKETTYAIAYMEKVYNRLHNQADGLENFLKFQTIMKSFDINVETPSDLYRKLEIFFGDEHADLTEEFLTFLTPGQATEVGRFMDYFTLTCMTDFIERLQVYFSNKPTQLRKVLWCLERLTEKPEAELTIDVIKNSILPLLKGNQYLIDWFLKLFPEEKPPDSLVNKGYEVVDFDMISKDAADDPLSRIGQDYEILDVPQIDDKYGNDVCICACHKSADDKYKNRSRHCLGCGMKYIQGRIYMQYGKVLRGVHLNWHENTNGRINQARRLSAPVVLRQMSSRRRAVSLDPSHPSIRNDSDDERISPKRVAKFLRTPSRGKNSKSSQLLKNLVKTTEVTDASQSHKPSCSKNIIKDDKYDKITSANIIPFDNISHKEDYFETFDEFNTHRVISVKQEPTSEEDECNQCLKMQAPCVDELNKMQNDSKVVLENNSIIESENDTKIVIKVDSEQITTDANNDNQNANQRLQIKTENEVNWTRDEDKIILQILRKESNQELTLQKIKQLLPHRSNSDINNRFKNVMSLLQKIATEP